MKLLIVAQKVDKTDNNLGSFHRWIEEFAQKTDRVIVIASYVGIVNLPSNVSIYSLGKEAGRNKFFRIFKFWGLLFKNYARVDAVFFHMAPEFILAATPWIISNKAKNSLWYTHKSVTWKLRLAEKLVDKIFTASSLSFRLPSKKVFFTGHAIDTDYFQPSIRPDLQQSQSFKIITVGRIAPSKNYEAILHACSLLKRDGVDFNYSIVGDPILSKDKKYLNFLRDLVTNLDLREKVSFKGAVPYTSVASVYGQYDIFVSTSSTGSMDKSVLEAMSCGLTVITSNESFKEILPEKYFLSNKDPKILAEKILELALEHRPNDLLRSLVVNNHGLHNTISAICNSLRQEYTKKSGQ